MTLSFSTDGGAFPGAAHRHDVEPSVLDEGTLRLWRALSPLDIHVRRALLASGRATHHRAGAPVVVEGQVAVVIDGCLSVDAGDEGVSAGIAGPGRLLGCGEDRLSGVWISDGELYTTSLAQWLALGGEAGVRHLLDAANAAHAALRRRVACVARHQATARLADLFRAIDEVEAPHRILLSQVKLGEMLGLRRTTVNASSRALQAAGALRTLRGQVRLLDPARLDDFACGCRNAKVLPRTDAPLNGPRSVS
ncbi:helix-turn-helix domain-containing protein [Brevundimonas sp. Root1279]|uniref:helix-turn-helix domain-containing protein n=1 Tax=Brevundimonas sp. Root1279 TaxID=1736443 RepID=UPI0006FA5D5E|nr:helix-turn-helix domain-containing protein [Brevundimonas sp. Root1279]KQW80756.1 hypothetical protein ASC65_12325 [Brevundimonas sp. Root1279]